MARPQAFLIHGRRFETQKDLRQYIREMRAKYPDEVHGLDADDHAFMLDFVQLHPRAPEKIGAGIARFTIRRPPEWPKNRTFYIIRKDDSDVEFSFVECLSPTPYAQRFRQACRAAIAQDIDDFVKSSFSMRSTVPCALTGDPVTRESYAVHHDPPFEELVRRFVAEYKIDVCAADIGGDGDHETRDYFRDSTLSTCFAEFHRIHGKLFLVTPDAHRKLPRKAKVRGDRTVLRSKVPSGVPQPKIGS